MNTKALVIGVAALVVVLLGVYFLYQSTSGSMTNQNGNTQDVVEAQDVSVGKGRAAEPGLVVSVLYEGKLSNGTVFDSSTAHGNEPLTFQLGAPGIIPGFQIGVNGMREGGERRMTIPASLGYGAQEVTNPSTGVVVVPANSTLVFSVKLIKVEDAPATTTAQ